MQQNDSLYGKHPQVTFFCRRKKMFVTVNLNLINSRILARLPLLETQSNLSPY
jgi:hypothetical protein